MHEMMGQEADRLAGIGLSRSPPLHSPGNGGHELFRIDQAAGAVPVDGVDMGVDLDEALNGRGGAPIPEGGQGRKA